MSALGTNGSGRADEVVVEQLARLPAAGSGRPRPRRHRQRDVVARDVAAVRPAVAVVVPPLQRDRAVAVVAGGRTPGSSGSSAAGRCRRPGPATRWRGRARGSCSASGRRAPGRCRTRATPRRAGSRRRDGRASCPQRRSFGSTRTDAQRRRLPGRAVERVRRALVVAAPVAVEVQLDRRRQRVGRRVELHRAFEIPAPAGRHDDVGVAGRRSRRGRTAARRVGVVCQSVDGSALRSARRAPPSRQEDAAIGHRAARRHPIAQERPVREPELLHDRERRRDGLGTARQPPARAEPGSRAAPDSVAWRPPRCRRRRRATTARPASAGRTW